MFKIGIEDLPWLILVKPFDNPVGEGLRSVESVCAAEWPAAIGRKILWNEVDAIKWGIVRTVQILLPTKCRCFLRRLVMIWQDIVCMNDYISIVMAFRNISGRTIFAEVCIKTRTSCSSLNTLSALRGHFEGIILAVSLIINCSLRPRALRSEIRVWIIQCIGVSVHRIKLVCDCFTFLVCIIRTEILVVSVLNIEWRHLAVIIPFIIMVYWGHHVGCSALITGWWTRSVAVYSVQFLMLWVLGHDSRDILHFIAVLKGSSLVEYTHIIFMRFLFVSVKKPQMLVIFRILSVLSVGICLHSFLT